MSDSTYHRKTVDELTFTDDFMFQAVLHEPEICAELIERLLHIKVKNVEYPELEKTIAPYYTFRNICKENTSVKLDDKSTKVIYNASAYEKEEDEKIRNLLEFISTNEPGKDDFSNRLSSTVKTIKENEKFRSDYAAMNLHDRDIQRVAKKEGIAEGARENAIETAKNFLRMKLGTIGQIAQGTGLTVEEVQKLAETMKNNRKCS